MCPGTFSNGSRGFEGPDSMTLVTTGAPAPKLRGMFCFVSFNFSFSSLEFRPLVRPQCTRGQTTSPKPLIFHRSTG